MYKIHREFGTAWYITTNRHMQAAIARDVMDVRAGLSAIVMSGGGLSRDQLLHLLKQHGKKLEAVYSQLIEPVRDIEIAEFRSTTG